MSQKCLPRRERANVYNLFVTRQNYFFIRRRQYCPVISFVCSPSNTKQIFNTILQKKYTFKWNLYNFATYINF